MPRKLSAAAIAAADGEPSTLSKRRIQRDGPVGADLARAIAQLAAVLPAASAKNSRPPPIAAPGKRQAIKAALKAGVKPTQVARHFGLSPAEVRKVAAQAD